MGRPDGNLDFQSIREARREKENADSPESDEPVADSKRQALKTSYVRKWKTTAAGDTVYWINSK